MNCTEFSNLLDAYFDRELPRETREALEEHARECPSCADRLTVLLDCRQADEEIEMPESFSLSWRQAIREESKMEKPKRKKQGRQNWLAAAAALIVVVGGTALTRDTMPRLATDLSAAETQKASVNENGTRAAGGLSTSFSYDAGTDTASARSMAAQASDVTEGEQTEKIIRSASFSLKTLSFDADLAAIEELAVEYGGRVEYFYQSGDTGDGELRRANLTLRIPASSLDDFLNGAQAYGQVTSMSQSSQDVSDSYYDIQSRLDVQKQKMERLQALMESAEAVADLVDIENAIADAQYAIDRYTGQLQNYDSQVEYNTVEVNLREIRLEESEELTLGQRIGLGVKQSLAEGADFLGDMAVFLLAVAPWVAAVCVVAFGVRFLIKRKHRKE